MVTVRLTPVEEGNARKAYSANLSELGTCSGLRAMFTQLGVSYDSELQLSGELMRATPPFSFNGYRCPSIETVLHVLRRRKADYLREVRHGGASEMKSLIASMEETTGEGVTIAALLERVEQTMGTVLDPATKDDLVATTFGDLAGQSTRRGVGWSSAKQPRTDSGPRQSMSLSMMQGALGSNPLLLQAAISGDSTALAASAKGFLELSTSTDPLEIRAANHEQNAGEGEDEVEKRGDSFTVEGGDNLLSSPTFGSDSSLMDFPTPGTNKRAQTQRGQSQLGAKLRGAVNGVMGVSRTRLLVASRTDKVITQHRKRLAELKDTAAKFLGPDPFAVKIASAVRHKGSSRSASPLSSASPARLRASLAGFEERGLVSGSASVSQENASSQGLDDNGAPKANTLLVVDRHGQLVRDGRVYLPPQRAVRSPSRDESFTAATAASPAMNASVLSMADSELLAMQRGGSRAPLCVLRVEAKQRRLLADLREWTSHRPASAAVVSKSPSQPKQRVVTALSHHVPPPPPTDDERVLAIFDQSAKRLSAGAVREPRAAPSHEHVRPLSAANRSVRSKTANNDRNSPTWTQPPRSPVRRSSSALSSSVSSTASAQSHSIPPTPRAAAPDHKPLGSFSAGVKAHPSPEPLERQRSISPLRRDRANRSLMQRVVVLCDYCVPFTVDLAAATCMPAIVQRVAEAAPMIPAGRVVADVYVESPDADRGAFVPLEGADELWRIAAECVRLKRDLRVRAHVAKIPSRAAANKTVPGSKRALAQQLGLTR
jgi:hypothetical protein